MAGLLFALLMLIASVLLVGATVTLGLWMRGASAIAFPGAGLLIATPLIFIMFLIAEAVVVVLAASLVRYIPLERLLSWMSHP
jgi:hypothetical protein